MHGVQATDIASTEDLNDAETDRVLDSGDLFVHVHNIFFFCFFFFICPVYLIFQPAGVLTDGGTFVIFGDTVLPEAYAQRFSTELQV